MELMKNKIQIESNNEKLLYFGNDDEENFKFMFQTPDLKIHLFEFSKERLEFIIKEMTRINNFIVKNEKTI